jgi:acetoin utilization deacetylase AcuC-like enzyme
MGKQPMKRTGLLYDERFLLHSTNQGHPECSDRLEIAYGALKEAGLLSQLTLIQATPARLKWIERVHSPRHIFRFEEACMLDLGELDNPDNQICKDSYDIALLAVGGILKTIDLVMEGKLDNAFCAVRPPGHHAEINRALGFCYFNNVAIAAKYLQEQWGVQRVGIVDVDAHHGNGTQQIFFNDPTVFYYSIHEHPSFSFPGTGREFERGIEEGEGFTLNSPVLPGQGDEAYQELLQRDLFPAFASFKPEVVLLSAGFDAHMDDDMSNINLSSEGYSWIMQRMVDLAEAYANGRLISILEGGYSLKRLPELIKNHLEILLDK